LNEKTCGLLSTNWSQQRKGEISRSTAIGAFKNTLVRDQEEGQVTSRKGKKGQEEILTDKALEKGRKQAGANKYG